MVDKPIRRELPDERQAISHDFRVGEQRCYLSVGLYEDGQPGEIFINASMVGQTVQGLLDTVAKLISASLQYGIPLAYVIHLLRGDRFTPNGQTGNEVIPVVSSVTDYIARWLEAKFIPEEDRVSIPKGQPTSMGCPDCGKEFYYLDGCLTCSGCGYNKCG